MECATWCLSMLATLMDEVCCVTLEYTSSVTSGWRVPHDTWETSSFWYFWMKRFVNTGWTVLHEASSACCFWMESAGDARVTSSVCCFWTESVVWCWSYFICLLECATWNLIYFIYLLFWTKSAVLTTASIMVVITNKCWGLHVLMGETGLKLPSTWIHLDLLLLFLIELYLLCYEGLTIVWRSGEHHSSFGLCFMF